MKWITREKVKVDRVACSWLIKRFIDSDAQFEFLPNDTDWSSITDGILFDVPGCELGHHGEDVSFDSLLNKHSLNDRALRLLAEIVRAADSRPTKTIPLPDVQGRIDHMSIDVKNQRFFMAALGNDTIEVIDLKAGKRIHTITGLHEPQGVLYLPDVNRLYVANGEDGS